MRIAFYNIFGELKNAEQETLMRLQYVFNEQGHELLIVDRDGYVISDGKCKGVPVENIDVDFLFTYNTLDFALVAFPDVFSIFFHWAPLGFVAPFQMNLFIKMFNGYDYFACAYEQNIFNDIVQIHTHRVPFIGSSLPKDFCVKPKVQKNRKLFYVGINLERALKNMRFGTLLQELDQTNLLEIYGPKEAFGQKNLWAGFQSYKGEIPFDGRSILEKINQAGVCLALNSPMHNDANAVSNRTYEAAAAGAVIISDDNEFVRKYFEDTVFYIDRNLSEEQASKRILEILEWVNQHPEQAYEMACKSQEKFMQKLTLDDMVYDCISGVQEAISITKDQKLQDDIIDVICFVESEDDFANISHQLQRQYYQNLHLIIVAPENVYQKLDISFDHDFVDVKDGMKGAAFIEVKHLLRGPYFMFIDKYTIMHMRHIYKNHDVLKNREELFCYSGCYIKTEAKTGKRYIVLNNKQILRDEFLLFRNSTADYTNWQYRDLQCFFIETIFSRSSALFSKDILQYADDNELGYISDAVHFYLACCSIIKAKKLGRFTYALTTGYAGASAKEVNETVFGDSRKHWISNSRSAKTYMKEMNEAFFKYTFESNPSLVYSRNFDGEITWYSDISSNECESNLSWMQRVIKLIKRIMPVKLKIAIKKCINA